jgi:hypothetical protein
MPARRLDRGGNAARHACWTRLWRVVDAAASDLQTITWSSVAVDRGVPQVHFTGCFVGGAGDRPSRNRRFETNSSSPSVRFLSVGLASSHAEAAES